MNNTPNTYSNRNLKKPHLDFLEILKYTCDKSETAGEAVLHIKTSVGDFVCLINRLSEYHKPISRMIWFSENFKDLQDQSFDEIKNVGVGKTLSSVITSRGRCAEFEKEIDSVTSKIFRLRLWKSDLFKQVVVDDAYKVYEDIVEHICVEREFKRTVLYPTQDHIAEMIKTGGILNPESNGYTVVNIMLPTFRIPIFMSRFHISKDERDICEIKNLKKLRIDFQSSVIRGHLEREDFDLVEVLTLSDEDVEITGSCHSLWRLNQLNTRTRNLVLKDILSNPNNLRPEFECLLKTVYPELHI